MVSEMFIAQGNCISKVLRVVGLPKSSYYYQPTGDITKRGRKMSQFTLTLEGDRISNEVIIDHVKGLLSKEFVDYGYRKVTYWLRQMFLCKINPKKVYSLLKQHKLLNPKKKHILSPRRWINDFVPNPSQPFEHIEMDIKYVYLHGKHKNALLLTAIDVNSRWVLGQNLSMQIKQKDVTDLFDHIFKVYRLPSTVFVRNDNGSQFEALYVQRYFQENNVIQEFTLPATPEQNAHIESYHSIVESVICQKYEFDSLQEAKATFKRFHSFYNFERIHSGINYLSPYEYLFQKGIDLKVNQSPSETFLLCMPNVN